MDKEFTYAAVLGMVFLEGQEIFELLKTLIAWCFKSEVSVFAPVFRLLERSSNLFRWGCKTFGADCDVIKLLPAGQTKLSEN